MFKSLREKLNKAVSKLSEMVYLKGSKGETEESREDIEDTTAKEKRAESLAGDVKKEDKKESKEKVDKNIGFFDRFRITKTIKRVLGKEVVLTEEDVEEVLEELELELLEADVAYEVTEKLIQSLRDQLIGRRIGPKEDPEEVIREALKNAIKEVLSQKTVDIYQVIEEKKKRGKPTVILFVGINGTGKTTTIAKLAYLLKKKGYSVVLAAGDTFRAGAIEQLEEHGKRIGVKVIKQQRGADSAAVIYDAIEHAKARGIDVVLADTAGRQATNVNLMEEIRKVVRVTKPDLVIFVGDALTGNDAIIQAEEFNKAVNFDGVILTKVDADAKGGAALSIAYAIGKPILFLGTGQRYEDLEEFSVEWMIDKLFNGRE